MHGAFRPRTFWRFVAVTVVLLVQFRSKVLLDVLVEWTEVYDFEWSLCADIGASNGLRDALAR